MTRSPRTCYECSGALQFVPANSALRNAPLRLQRYPISSDRRRHRLPRRRSQTITGGKYRHRQEVGGRGADLILDPIGGKGFGRNFDMLAPLGMVVSYGRLDGPPDADLLTAMRANSAKSPAVRFFTIHSFDDRPDIRAAAMTVLLDHLAAGRIRPLIHDRLPLAEAGRAQALLESGQVIGKLLLKP